MSRISLHSGAFKVTTRAPKTKKSLYRIMQEARLVELQPSGSPCFHYQPESTSQCHGLERCWICNCAPVGLITAKAKCHAPDKLCSADQSDTRNGQCLSQCTAR